MEQQIGHYTILRKLGEGNMGVVFAARDDRLGRSVAIKLIQKENTDSSARQRFLREARAAAAVNHPNICHIYDVGEHEGELYVAMELLEGELLSDRIDRGPIALGEGVNIVLSVLDALGAIHRAGLVHRDLKPSNLFVTPHGVKLLDFGLARATDPGGSKTAVQLTTPGTIVGTPRYMAPEQWSGEEVGPATDLFACGAILFEILTGKPAFQGETLPAVCHAIMHGEPPALTGGPNVQAVDRVINRALAKRAADRYHEAAEMAADLRALASTQRSGTVALESVRAVTRMMVLPFRLLRADAEIDFLPTSLADAVTASLCGLESLVVRSSRSAAGVNDSDVKKVASDADVDLVLLGTLLRSGDKLRLNAQLIDDSGRVIWSKTLQSAANDIFDLQDELTAGLLESLPLSKTAGQELHRDVPATAHAYELYLRAMHTGVDTLSTSRLLAARDLLRECVREDPRFAPAWARLGRMYRVIAKYAHDAPEENRRLAEEAFRKALEIHPDLPLTHNLYTYFELEEMHDMPGAITRLVAQVRRRPNDPDLFAGLVTACRFGGMLEASVAADQRARRLDPQINTSVSYTYWMLGDYERLAAMSAAGDTIDFPGLISRAHVGRKAEVIEELRRIGARTDGAERDVLLAIRGSLEGDRETTVAASKRTMQAAIPDPEHWFVWSSQLAGVQETDLTLLGLRTAVEGNFCFHRTVEHDPRFDFLRGNPEFERLMGESRERHRRAANLFRDSGGEELLGVKV